MTETTFDTTENTCSAVMTSPLKHLNIVFRDYAYKCFLSCDKDQPFVGQNVWCTMLRLLIIIILLLFY